MYIFSKKPTAFAHITGGSDAPNLEGNVKFYQKQNSVLVVASISGLPKNTVSGFFAFHIHDGFNCSGVGFSNTKGHYNPTGVPHPNHAGDLPSLLYCGGNAYLSFITDRFRVDEIIGRTVVIHDGTDDFKSQPAGNAGKKIACGVILSK